MMDLVKAFYIIIIDGVSMKHGNKLLGWLDFDLDAFKDNSIQIPAIYKLTYEVRQEVLAMDDRGSATT